MKTKTAAIVTVLILLPAIAAAHSGGTDKNGGHWNRQTGEYHYHHGYSAHQHTNGECPYNFEDKTGQRSTKSTRKTEAAFSIADYWWVPAAGAGVGGYAVAKKRG